MDLWKRQDSFYLIKREECSQIQTNIYDFNFLLEAGQLKGNLHENEEIASKQL